MSVSYGCAMPLRSSPSRRPLSLKWIRNCTLEVCYCCEMLAATSNLSQVPQVLVYHPAWSEGTYCCLAFLLTALERITQASTKSHEGRRSKVEGKVSYVPHRGSVVLNCDICLSSIKCSGFCGCYGALLQYDLILPPNWSPAKFYS